MTKAQAETIAELMTAAAPGVWAAHHHHWSHWLVARKDWGGDPDEPHFDSIDNVGGWLACDLNEAWDQYDKEESA